MALVARPRQCLGPGSEHWWGSHKRHATAKALHSCVYSVRRRTEPSNPGSEYGGDRVGSLPGRPSRGTIAACGHPEGAGLPARPKPEPRTAMIACVDVDYRGDVAVAACLLFREWADERVASETVRRI